MKQRTTWMCAAMFACAPVLAQEVVYLPAQAPIAGMDGPVCFQATSNEDTMQLRMLPSRAYMLRRNTAAGLAGEEYGAWATDGAWTGGNDVTFEAYNTSTDMPVVARTWHRRDGSLQAADEATKTWTTFTPTPCKGFAASDYALPMATLHLPEGLGVTERSDTRDFGTGVPGMYVIVEDDKQSQAILQMSVIYAAADAAPMDVREQAVRHGNPMDDTLSAAEAQDIAIDGVAAAKYDNTMRALGVSTRWLGYAVERNNCRITVEISGGTEQNALLDKMGAIVETMTWKDYTCPAPAAES